MPPAINHGGESHASAGSSAADAGTIRATAFGQLRPLSLVDRFGIWLSGRQIQNHAPEWQGKRIADIGCGYYAAFARSLLDFVHSATLVDVSIAPELCSHPKVSVREGVVPTVLEALPARSFDVVLCISLLEHLWNPLEAVCEFHRLLAPGGVCMINVPSWRGKKYLEYSAFTLGLSPAEEMDDHKHYFDVSDLWPILVRAGFCPSSIRCFPHKFGLNTFAVCRAGE